MKRGDGQQEGVEVQSFQIHVADEVLADLRVRLRHTRWPDELPGIGWEQGTERDWLRHLVSYWADTFDWRAWERKLNTLHHFTWEGIHFVHQRAASGRGVPLILTHGWPGSFLDYVDMLPMLEDFDVVVPSLPGYGFSPRPLEVGINYRYVSERWHRLMTALGYSHYGAGGGDFGAGVSTFLALDHAEAVIGIHLTTPELIPKVEDAALSDEERSYLAVNRGWAEVERGYSSIQSTNHRPSAMASTTPRQGWPHIWARNGARGAMSRRRTISSVPRLPCTGPLKRSLRRCAIIGIIVGIRSTPPTSARPRRSVSLRTRRSPRVSRRARIWSACTTSDAGRSFRTLDTSPRLRSRQPLPAISAPSSAI